MPEMTSKQQRVSREFARWIAEGMLKKEVVEMKGNGASPPFQDITC